MTQRRLGATGMGALDVRTRPVRSTFRASPAQEGIWLAPFSAAVPSPFNLLWSIRFKGPLDPERLQLALCEITRRHQALRATFRWADGHVEQRIGPANRVDLPVEDVASADAAAAVAKQFGEAPYDLGEGPPCRFKLVRTSPDEHCLLCGFHHLVIDGGSWSIFAEELIALLSGARLPDLAPRLAAGDEDRGSQVGSGGWSRARNYWRAKRRVLPDGWDLPPDGPGAGRRDTAGGHIVTVLPEDLSARLRHRARELQSTPFRTALAAYAACLGLMARRDDVVVATTLTGRTDAETAALIGLFANTGILTADISGGTSLRQLVRRLNAQLDEAIEHQDFPFRFAVREGPPLREVMSNRFTEAAFVKMPRAVVRRIGELEISDRRIFLSGVDHDLAAFLQETGAAFSLTWCYRARRFQPSTVASFARLFERLLAQALARPDDPLDQLDLVTDEERRRMLIDLSGEAHAFADLKPVHRLVEAQAARTPDRTAIVSAERTWSYREVNGAANALARRLKARGVGPGAFVPLLMAASAELFIAELAVMKCGAAFAPLGPDWPSSRIEALLGQLGTRLVIVRDCGEAAAAEGCDLIDLSRTDLGSDPGDPPCDAGLDDAIYCMFTSGSTGAPKGAVNLHRGIANRLLAMSRAYGGAEEVVLVTAASTVDMHVWEFAWPLICGGCVVVAPPEQVVAPDHLHRLILRHGVTTIDLVPAIFDALARRLAQTPQVHALASLRRILVGGEAMNAASVYAFKAQFPSIDVFNTYGPTETSIGVLYLKVPEAYTDPVPLGRPYPNIRVVILDERLRLTPIGTAGELCLGGDCVGRGYLGDPAATRAKFIANPYPELGCETLYRTGDLAKLRPDGNIEFLGRLDDQIKINGVRIEPGEVEAALLRHPAVQDALVARTEAPGGDAQLAAYVVLAEGAPAPDAAQLQQVLRQRLPRHMTPSVFVKVERLPRNGAGKLDRRAARLLKGEALAQQRPWEGPRTPAESDLAQIWREILKVDQVGVHDHFFADLNGDSLKALLFVLRFEERFGRKTDVSRLFEAPTIAAFAAGLADRQDPSYAPRAAAGGLLEDLLSRQRLYLASWTEGRLSPDSFLFAPNPLGRSHPLFWCCQGFQELVQLASRLGPHQPVVGMRSGHLIMDYSDQNILALASHYAREIRAVQPEGEIRLGGNCQGGQIARGVAQQLRAAGREVALLVLMEETEFRPYDGRVALLFGRDSRLNPYNSGPDPDAVFRRAYGDGYEVAIIPGAHGLFFTDQNIPGLAAVIAEQLRRAAPHEPVSLQWLEEVD